MKAFHLSPPQRAFEEHSLRLIQHLAETRQGFDVELYQRARALVLKKVEQKQP